MIEMYRKPYCHLYRDKRNSQPTWRPNSVIGLPPLDFSNHIHGFTLFVPSNLFSASRIRILNSLISSKPLGFTSTAICLPVFCTWSDKFIAWRMTSVLSRNIFTGKSSCDNSRCNADSRMSSGFLLLFDQIL